MFTTFYNRSKKPIGVTFSDETFVDQSEAEMCGLHYQLQRYGVDGLLARFETMKDKFGYADTRLIPSFAELQNRIVKGVDYFNRLPSEIRHKFGNNVGNFYTYLEEHPEDAVKNGYISNVDVTKYKLQDVVKDIQSQKTETVTINEVVKEEKGEVESSL